MFTIILSKYIFNDKEEDFFNAYILLYLIISFFQCLMQINPIGIVQVAKVLLYILTNV